MVKNFIGNSTIQSGRCENSGSNPPAPGVWIEKNASRAKGEGGIFFQFTWLKREDLQAKFSRLKLWIVVFILNTPCATKINLI